MRKLIKASASAKLRASKRIKAARSLNLDPSNKPPVTKLYAYDNVGNDIDVQYLGSPTESELRVAVKDMFLSDDDIQTIDVVIGPEGWNESDEVSVTFDRDADYDEVFGSTDVNADLQLNKENKKKYNWGDNPITDLDGYVKDIADGVVERFPNVTYEISDEAITFMDENSNIIYVQPIDEIVPEKEDLDNDILELGDAVQHEFEDADWFSQASEEDEDDPDYASRAVTL